MAPAHPFHTRSNTITSPPPSTFLVGRDANPDPSTYLVGRDANPDPAFSNPILPARPTTTLSLTASEAGPPTAYGESKSQAKATATIHLGASHGIEAADGRCQGTHAARVPRGPARVPLCCRRSPPCASPGVAALGVGHPPCLPSPHRLHRQPLPVRDRSSGHDSVPNFGCESVLERRADHPRLELVGDHRHRCTDRFPSVVEGRVRTGLEKSVAPDPEGHCRHHGACRWCNDLPRG